MTVATRPGHYNPDDPYVMDQVPLRHAALMNATAGIRVRRQGTISVDRILLIVASVLLPLGLILILVGWYGAAHTGKFFEQIDYLMSGGLLGLALAGTGGFMYFGYWLSRQLEESRQHNELALRALQRIDDHLMEQAAAFAARDSAVGRSDVGRPGETIGPKPAPGAGLAPFDGRSADNGSHYDAGPAGPGTSLGWVPTAAPAPSASDAPTGQVPVVLVATARGSLLHRAGCAMVAGKAGLRAVAAGTPGFRYCTVCGARALVEAS